MRRALAGILSLSIIAGGAVLLPALTSSSGAADGSGVYGTWSLDPADRSRGTVDFTGSLFPQAQLTSSGQNLSTSTSQVLKDTTPFGMSYGASTGRNYLSVGLQGGVARANVTLTFDEPPVPGTYGLVMGDVDAENVILSATDASGQAVDVSEWNGTEFNYAGGTDLPRWDAATGTITGNGSDTAGASMWIVPSAAVRTITLTQTRTSGFPAYQLWIAADVLTTAAITKPTPSATVIPSAPAGKVTICHRTSSDKNPYVEMTIDEAAVTRRGHDHHDGGIYPDRPWGDIIPAFGTYRGKNLGDGGAAILANGCKTGSESLVVTPLATLEPTASPSASPTVTDDASASPSPSASGTATASPGATDASPEPGTSTTPSPLPTPDRTEEPQPPVVVNPDGPTTIDVPGDPIGSQGAEGTIELGDREITYTPKPGFTGIDTFTVLVEERDGEVVALPMRAKIGKAAKPCAALPRALEFGANRLPAASGACQPVRVTVRCTPLLRTAPTGDVARCTASTTNGRSTVTVRDGAPVSVRVTVTAKATANRPSVRQERTYRLR